MSVTIDSIYAQILNDALFSLLIMSNRICVFFLFSVLVTGLIINPSTFHISFNDDSISDDSEMYSNLLSFAFATKMDTEDDDVEDFHHGLVGISNGTSVIGNITSTEGNITLCHIPPGNQTQSHSITVASSSVSAHLAHGDYLGTCDDSDDDTNDHPILGFDKAKVITSSNTGVIQLYNKILDLQSNPSISLENLKNQVSSVANLYTFLADADKQDRKEFQELFHDYKEIVKQLLKKADEQSKRTIENILEQAEDTFKALNNHEKNHQDEKESKHKENHQDKKESKHKENHQDKKDKDHKDKKDNH